MTRPINVQDIYGIANQRGVPAALVALEHGREDLLTQHTLWMDPVSDDAEDDIYPQIDLLGESSDVLADYCRSLAASIQFPVNTAYLHGLGVVSSAMNRSFRYDYFGSEKPVNLYCVTSQPPSTGKSGINTALTMPCRIAYSELNKRNAKILKEATERMDAYAEQLKDAKSPGEREQLKRDIEEQQKIIEANPIYRYAVDDSTPEALEHIAFSQGGLFNVVSDEADAINILLGNVYSDSKANYGLFLKGWDGDWHSPARITRKTSEGPVYGSIAVIAQDESINAILHAGMSGRGISERILIMREKTLLGHRNHLEHQPVDKEARAEYDMMINALINEPHTVLKIEREGMEYLKAYRHNMESKLADGAEYSNAMLRGSMGKADKQIIKLACVMHGVRNWCQGGERSKTVTMDTIIQASHTYNELSKTYISAADSQGYMGINAELAQLKETLTKRMQKGTRRLSVAQLKDGVKNLKTFRGVSKLSAKIKDEYIPLLVEHGYCVMHQNSIWINPKLK